MGEEHLSLQPGTVIAGRYEVVKCLGAGSMGLVYACRNRDLQGHMVAVKVLFPEVSRDKIAAARFRNEIFASYGVSHPNVVRAYEYLRDGDLVAYTMEFVGGGDLADRLGKPGELVPVDEIIDLLAQMCDGVQAIHDAGIVHRDLKPENILLSKDGRVKIADFGIARTGHGPKLTEHGGVVGTIDYVSPEYMLNSHVDWRSDIYALGILAYEMTTAESPFRGDSVYATMTKRLKTDPKPPTEIREEVPIELERIILKAMARDPEERYQSARQMGSDLRALQSGNPISVEHDSRRDSGSYSSGSHDSGKAGAYIDDTSSALEPFVEQPSETFISAARPSPTQPPSSSSPTENVSLSYQLGKDSTLPSASMRSDSGAAPPLSGPAREPDPFAPVQSSGASAARYSGEETIFSSDTFRPAATSSPELRPRSPQLSAAVSSGGFGSDAHRMKRLSDLSESVNRSLWVDLITWIAAIAIGIAVGFTTLKYVLPDISKSRAPVAEPVKEIETELK